VNPVAGLRRPNLIDKMAVVRRQVEQEQGKSGERDHP
jgi:hypothetical protein